MKLMMKRGFSLVGVIIVMVFVAVLISGGYFLFSNNEDEDSYIEEKLDAIEQAEDVKNLVDDRNKVIQEIIKEDEIITNDEKSINIYNDPYEYVNLHNIDVSDWQVFLSDVYGIGFSAPKGAEIVEDGTNINITNLEPLYTRGHYLPGINITENAENFSLLDVAKNKIYKYSYLKYFVYKGIPAAYISSEGAGATYFVTDKYIFEIFSFTDSIFDTIYFDIKKAGNFEKGVILPTSIKYFEDTGEIQFYYDR